MQVQVNSEEERLIAEQALLMYRASLAAAEAAPHGQGLAAIEDAVLEQGRQQMRLTIEQALKAQARAQKGGHAARGVAKRQRSKANRPKT